MKKAVLVFLFFFGYTLAAFAQSGYLRLGTGFAVPQAGQSIDGTATPYNGSISNSDSTSTYKIAGASFSSGLHAYLAGGYMITEHVGIDLGLDLGLSTKKYSANQYNVAVGGVASDVSIVQQAQTPITLNPSVVFQSGHSKTNLYARVGLALPLKTKVRQDFMITNRPGTGATETDDYIWTFKSNISLGFTAALGVQYNISDNVAVWFEASMLSLAPYLKEGDLEDITVNGQGGYKQQVPTSQWKINYSKSFTAASQDYYNQPSYTQPFSNAAFNIGFRFSVGSSHSSSSSSDHGRNFIRKPQGRF